MRLQKFLLKGNMALKGQYTDEAEKYFNEALLIDPCYADALNNPGTMRFDTQHHDEAVTFIQRPSTAVPGFLAPVFNRANAYPELKEYYSAEKDADYLVKHKPDTAVAHFIRGLVKAKLHDFKLPGNVSTGRFNWTRPTWNIGLTVEPLNITSKIMRKHWLTWIRRSA